MKKTISICIEEDVVEMIDRFQKEKKITSRSVVFDRIINDFFYRQKQDEEESKILEAIEKLSKNLSKLKFEEKNEEEEIEEQPKSFFSSAIFEAKRDMQD